jgi:hypothetical protein
MLVRRNHTSETLLELSRTDKKVRCVTLLQHEYDVRNLDLIYTELVGFNTSKKLITYHFDKQWPQLDYSPIRWAIKMLIGYIPLTARAKKELVMLILSIFTQNGTTAVNKFNDLDTAVQASPAGAEVVKVEQEELFGLSGSDLVRLFNSIVPEDKHIKKFATKVDAVRRFTEAAEAYAATLPECTDGHCPGEDKAAKKAEKEAAKAAKEQAKTDKVAAKAAAKEMKTSSAANVHTKISDDLIIHLLVAKNPKRETAESGKRFALYKEGMTVKAALDAGVLKADLSWDTRHAFIKLVPA